MAKGQVRSNREAKKPKQNKAPKAVTTTPTGNLPIRTLAASAPTSKKP